MQLLKDRILTDGVVKEGNILKVDSFLNHQMDIDLINEVGKEFKKRFDHCPITKILNHRGFRYRHCLYCGTVFPCTGCICQESTECEP